MLPIKIVDGVAKLDVSVSRKLTEKQKATLKYLEKNFGKYDVDLYMNSLLGLTKGHIFIPRIRTSSGRLDLLAQKPKNSILDQFRQVLDCDAEHRPTTRSIGRWVGVEIECYIPHDNDFDEDDEDSQYDSEKDAHYELSRAISRAKIPRVSVKSDGSLQDDSGHGVEVTILFNTADGYGPLIKLCEVLNKRNCYVNKKCGIHVHLDMRHASHTDVKLIGKRLGRSIPILKYMVDKSRHENTYCKLEVSKFRRGSPRYFAVNLNSYFTHKTIEVRMHGGSTSATKIQNWVELLQFLSVSEVPKKMTEFQQLIDLGLPEHLVEYADNRISKLNPEAWAILVPTTPTFTIAIAA